MVYLNLYSIDWRCWQSILIALVTRSIYTHAGIQVGEHLFEISAHRESAGWVHTSVYADRDVRQIPINLKPDLAEQLLSRYVGKQYDHLASVGFVAGSTTKITANTLIRGLEK